MPKYYEVQAINRCDQLETLYGSFLRADCKDEIECERDNWKADGYSKIRIVPRDTLDIPDPEVYAA